MQAGEPLADGSLSVEQARDSKGCTALLNSALKADFVECAVAVLNVKFPSYLFRSGTNREKPKFRKEGVLHKQKEL